jgi:regulator of sigma E protease
MHSGWSVLTNTLAAGDPAWLGTSLSVIKVVIGFSVIIFVHELGHFLAAKWAGIRVDRFAVGFGYRLFGWRRGEGFTLGKRPNYTADEQQAHNFGETDYCFNVLPFGGYVKMLGQDDIVMNDETGEIKMSDDPRAFTNKPVGKRMVVASAGVLFNALFAILAYTCVFMIGKPEIAPRLGPIDASTPAAAAGLRPNDLILTANGEKVSSFRDVATALVLADSGSVVFQVERDGHVLPEPIVLHTPHDAENPLAATGVGPATTAELENAPAFLERYPQLRAGDRITEVAGQPVQSAADFLYAFSRYVTASGTPEVAITVARPDPHDPARTNTVKVTLPAELMIDPGVATTKSDPRADTDYILGMSARREVGYVRPGQPADKAGVRAGDVIAQWGGIPNPLFSEIVASIQANPDRPIPVVVERDGKSVNLVVTPERPFQLLGTAKPQVGIEFGHEYRQPIVANVADGTPASTLRMPRGSRILAVNGTPTDNWFDVLRLLRDAAGQTVTVRYRTGDTQTEGRMAVPSSIVDALHLPPLALIMSIAGENQLSQDNQILRLPGQSAVRGLLEKHRGQTVTVEYQLTPEDPQIQRGEFAVAADGSNADPWQMRIVAIPPPNMPFKRAQTIVRAGNPVAALSLGARQTGAVVVEMYRLVTTITRNLVHGDTSTMQHISGPVGIVGYAVERARLGYVELLGFLAFLSVNLAVINFIPFPVVDGGLMVFLIIEKIKGRPLSLKTQMVATLVGLATIILVFVLVTFKDITHLLN